MSPVTWRPTPNPDSVRFQLPVQLAGDEGWSFPAAGTQAASTAPAHLQELARQVLLTEGVISLYVVNSMASVTRSPGAEWDTIVEPVAELLARACEAAAPDSIRGQR